jgi:hypothetical protein
MVAKVRIVVEALLSPIGLGASRTDALGSFGALVGINEPREVFVSSRSVTWRTHV